MLLEFLVVGGVTSLLLILLISVTVFVSERRSERDSLKLTSSFIIGTLIFGLWLFITGVATLFAYLIWSFIPA